MADRKFYYPAIKEGGENKICADVERSLGVKTTYGYDALLVIIMHATAVTVSEILLLCPYLGRKAVTRFVLKLKSFGYVLVLPFTASRAVSEGGVKKRVRKNVAFDGSRRYIGLTKKGVRHLKELGVDTANAFPVTKELSIQHSYATGYNLVELMKLPCDLRWIRESAFYYDRGSDETQSGVYRTDADGIISDGARRMFLHIEQDMCTELTGVLIDKCDHYIHGDLMDRREDVLIFSIWKEAGGYGIRKDAYSSRYLRGLSDMLLTCGAGHVAALLGHGEFWPDQEGLKEVIKTYSPDYGENGITSAVLKTVAERLDGGYEPVQRADVNAVHSKGAFSRLYSFVRMAGGFKKVPGTKVEEPDIYVLISSLLCLNAFWGNQIIFAPTALLAKKVPFMAPLIFNDMQRVVGLSFSKYFDRLEFKADHTESLFDTTDVGGFSGQAYPVCLRNQFDYKKNGIEGTLCVEFLSMDAGAWFRAMLFERYLEHILKTGGTERPLILVLVFDDEGQRDKFFKTGNYYHRGAFGFDYTSYSMAYIYSYDLGDPDAFLESVAYVDREGGEVVDVRLVNLG